MAERLAAARVIVLFVLAFLLSPTLVRGQIGDVSNKDDVHLFLLIGQSNMAGRGRVMPSDETPHPRVFMFNKDKEWVPAIDPLHFDKPKIAGVGLGKTFGIEIAHDNPKIAVGLIPCAVGGSSITTWEPGILHESTKSHPWDDAISRAKAALQSGTLKGILWHQGESDSNAKRSDSYQSDLQDLIERIRTELNAEEVPFLIGQLGQFEERPWNEYRQQVDAAHRSQIELHENNAFVSSYGLKHKGDETHFDTDSYREFGRRYADAYRKLTEADRPDVSQMPFQIERIIAHQGFDKQTCWVHARAGVIPPEVEGSSDSHPEVVLTTQALELTGSDVFHAIHTSRSTDGGAIWTPLVADSDFEREHLSENIEQTVCDFTPAWHAATKTLLGIGHTVVYEKNRVKRVRPRSTAYSVFDPTTGDWSPYQTLKLPDEPRFQNAGAGSAQRLDLPNGDILLPIYFKEPSQNQLSSTVCRCRFDGTDLTYLEHGSEMTVPIKRGLYEPSITSFNGKFYLTMRNDNGAYVAVSDDGLKYSTPQLWRFDDGEELGSYNTQAHWVSHPKGLFLVYTRRGLDNDHVFRHRAPLVIGRVDPETQRVIRATERILVPEYGARLGNFGITEVSEEETWVTVAEWMQPVGVEKYGSNNRIWVARLLWEAD
ncbi:Carbohydrate acetyl esterase/feruloyl esterase precursor [Thalassoglobus neptunius]|uniref:Carbohydrate acetyl esterase/feruloyl esterase n=1 Tax=Thalassoglobus neptunius TaxID=1938619 RepID=A0A5C5W185_9PLAN|nr:sialate O-acetylesterase [Thalassoglobus neptunius]TWT43532.1 Carbohydrate acetyl esterase/feruloyl esterase precursor [Thalassoglobus neptunius]